MTSWKSRSRDSGTRDSPMREVCPFRRRSLSLCRSQFHSDMPASMLTPPPARIPAAGDHPPSAPLRNQRSVRATTQRVSPTPAANLASAPINPSLRPNGISRCAAVSLGPTTLIPTAACSRPSRRSPVPASSPMAQGTPPALRSPPPPSNGSGSTAGRRLRPSGANSRTSAPVVPGRAWYTPSANLRSRGKLTKSSQVIRFECAGDAPNRTGRRNKGVMDRPVA